MPRVSTIERTMWTMPKPRQWTAAYVRHRLIEAIEIERRLPNPGPAGGSSSWVPVLHEFADVVGWTDARERVWDNWSRARGAMPWEVSRMDEAIGWVRELAAQHPGEARCLAAWATTVSTGAPLTRLLRRRRWAFSTFYRKINLGSERIAAALNARGVTVR